MKKLFSMIIFISMFFLAYADSRNIPQLVINPPDLTDDINKISAEDAEMPALVFGLNILGIPTNAILEYRWWLRVNYISEPLTHSPNLSSFGCSYRDRQGYATVWALPGGNIDEICINDLSTRNTWISTTAPILDLTKPLQIHDQNGKMYTFLFKELNDNPISDNGTIIYGGGELELVVQVIYKDSDNKIQAITAHYPDKSDNHYYLTGLNPNPKQLKNALKEILTALSSTNPTPQQQALRTKITGSADTSPISPAFAAVLIPILDGIACRETQRKHFCDPIPCLGVEKIKGYPILSFDGGYGMFQLTDPSPNYHEIWSWKENLIATIRAMYTHVLDAASIANTSPNINLQEQIYFRELISRHNASNISYFEQDRSRDPILCREQISFKKNAPYTDIIYKQNLEDEQGLLQALEAFGVELQSEVGIKCAEKMGRQISYEKIDGAIEIVAISTCHPGTYELIDSENNITSSANIPDYYMSAIYRFGSYLIDDKMASCNYSGFYKNAGRHIGGKFIEPNIYIIDTVGRCLNSPICYVDVDVSPDGCMDSQERGKF